MTDPGGTVPGRSWECSFIAQLLLDRQPAAVVCTYKTSPGKMLGKMATALEAREARALS